MGTRYLGPIEISGSAAAWRATSDFEMKSLSLRDPIGLASAGDAHQLNYTTVLEVLE